MRYRMWLHDGKGGKRENWCGITVDFPERVKESGFHYHIVHIPDDFPNACEIASMFTEKNRMRWRLKDGYIAIWDNWYDFAYLVPDEPQDAYDAMCAIQVEKKALIRAMESATKLRDFQNILVWQADFTRRFAEFEAKYD